VAAPEPSAVERNLAFYQGFWEETPDFVRYNPGAQHRRRMILDLLRSEGFGSLLDVGCGSGELIALIAQERRGATLAGADLSPLQVERNRERLPGVEFFALDAQSSALPRTFDAVVCSEVIEHLDDSAAAIANLARMVAPGGRLLVTCPAGPIYATERHFGHVRHPTARELCAWATAAGLEIETLWNWGWPTYAALKWATNLSAEWALKNFASGPYTPSAKAVSRGLYWLNYLNQRNSPRGCQLFAVFRRSAHPA
jgi:SAM-dependent methyltransferase